MASLQYSKSKKFQGNFPGTCCRVRAVQKKAVTKGQLCVSILTAQMNGAELVEENINSRLHRAPLDEQK